MLAKNISEVVSDIAISLGISLTFEKLKGNENFDYSLRATSFDRPEGFSLLLAEGLHSWDVHFRLDNFAGGMLRLFQTTFPIRKEDVLSVKNSTTRYISNLEFSINGKPIEDCTKDETWSILFLFARARSLEEGLKYQSLREILLVSLCLLLPLFTENSENEFESLDEFSSHPEMEGALSRIETNKYERSRLNRSLCLAHHGFLCAACGLLMETKYGPLGKEVINVHHIVPVSQMNGLKLIDPAIDLVPLCPNCHVIVHRQNPPLSISELKEIIQN